MSDATEDLPERESRVGQAENADTITNTNTNTNTNTIRINELFVSVQGEGRLIGQPTVFVRTTGCNLRCRRCDTEYAYHDGEEMSVGAVLEAVAAYGRDHVCVTGGEPLIQPASTTLIRALVDGGYHVTVETNGSLPIDTVLHRRTPSILISLDVKCPSSGMADRLYVPNLTALRPADQVKFVLADEEDYEFATATLRRHGPLALAIFMPVGGQDARWIAERVIEERVSARVLVQLHKLLWGAEARGV